MKKIILAMSVILLFTSTVVFAQASSGDTVTIKGTIICNKCAGDHKDDLAGFVTGHSKMCMMHAGCAASGYSIYSEGKLEKFTADSDKQIKDFLANENSTPNVEITAQKKDQELNLISIKSI